MYEAGSELSGAIFVMIHAAPPDGVIPVLDVLTRIPVLRGLILRVRILRGRLAARMIP